MVNVFPSRHEVFVRFRLCPLSAHDEDGDVDGEAGRLVVNPVTSYGMLTTRPPCAYCSPLRR